MYSYTIIAWEVIVRLLPYFHLPNPSSAQIMFGVYQGTLRPKPVANCPTVLKLLYAHGMSGESAKRPSMKLIYDIMSCLDRMVNKSIPILPIVDQDDHQPDSGNVTPSMYANLSKDFSAKF